MICSDYGFSLKTFSEHTLYQLQALARSGKKRKSITLRHTSYAIALMQNGKASQIEQFFKSLE